MAAILNFWPKKGHRIIFRMGPPSKFFWNIILYACAKCHTSITISWFGIVFRHTPLPLYLLIQVKRIMRVVFVENYSLDQQISKLTN